LALSYDAAIKWLSTVGGTCRAERYGDTNDTMATAQVRDASRSASSPNAQKAKTMAINELKDLLDS
jgi:hypothetical protein